MDKKVVLVSIPVVLAAIGGWYIWSLHSPKTKVDKDFGQPMMVV